VRALLQLSHRQGGVGLGGCCQGGAPESFRRPPTLPYRRSQIAPTAVPSTMRLLVFDVFAEDENGLVNNGHRRNGHAELRTASMSNENYSGHRLFYARSPRSMKICYFTSCPNTRPDAVQHAIKVLGLAQDVHISYHSFSHPLSSSFTLAIK
jgi:hypothetical protein